MLPCGTGVEAPPLALESPRVDVGHTTPCPRLDTISFRHLSTARPPAEEGAALASPTRGDPLDPGDPSALVGATARTLPYTRQSAGLRSGADPEFSSAGPRKLCGGVA